MRTQGRSCLLAGLAGALLLCGGCTETFQLIWRTRLTKPEPKSLPAPNYRLTMLDWPSDANPTVSVKVEQQKFWIETAEKIRRQFKKFDDGRFEPVVPPREETQSLARVTGKTEWVPAPGIQVVFRVGSDESGTPVPTDDKGVASFDVSPYCEMWIEGRDLQVEVTATLKSIADAEAWKKARGKPPQFLKNLKVVKTPFLDTVQVDARTLEKIFGRR